MTRTEFRQNGRAAQLQSRAASGGGEVVLRMNTDSKIMKVIRPVDKAAPGQLASDLEKARVTYENARQDVISRGAARQQELANLQAEIAAEQTQVEQVLTDAREG